jgi:hypothetical protein
MMCKSRISRRSPGATPLSRIAHYGADRHTATGDTEAGSFHENSELCLLPDTLLHAAFEAYLAPVCGSVG